MSYRPRILTPEEERLTWLLDFIERDLTTLRPGERLDLTEDVLKVLSFRDPSIDLASVDPPDGYAFALKKKDMSWTHSLLVDLQAQLLTGIAKLEAGQTWEPFAKPLIPFYEKDADGTIARRYRGLAA